MQSALTGSSGRAAALNAASSSSYSSEVIGVDAKQRSNGTQDLDKSRQSPHSSSQTSDHSARPSTSSGSHAQATPASAAALPPSCPTSAQKALAQSSSLPRNAARDVVTRGTTTPADPADSSALLSSAAATAAPMSAAASEAAASESAAKPKKRALPAPSSPQSSPISLLTKQQQQQQQHQKVEDGSSKQTTISMPRRVNPPPSMPNKATTAATSSASSPTPAAFSSRQGAPPAAPLPVKPVSTTSGSLPARSSSSIRKESKEYRSSTDTTVGDEEADSEVKVEKKKHTRRKKANRACMHCQKAHLTCDDARPCERCIKKGLADSCTDGARKKAKYLLDEEEIMELKRGKEAKKRESMASTAGESGRESEETARVKIEEGEPVPMWPSAAAIPAAPPPPPAAAAAANGMSLKELQRQQNSMQTPLGGFTSSTSTTVAPSALTDGTIVGREITDKGSLYTNAPLRHYSPASSAGYNPLFGSEATSLEYNMLSSMLNGIDPSWLSGSSPDQQQGQELGSALAANNSDSLNGGLPHMGLDGMPWRFATDSNVLWQDQADIKFQQLSNSTPRPPYEQLKTPAVSSHVEPLHHMDSSRLPQGVEGGVAAYDALEVPSPHGSSGPKGSPSSSGQSGPSPALTSRPNPRSAAAAAAAAAAGQDKKPDAVWMERVKHVYSDRMRPFPYTEGYHFLIKYVTANLEKAEVLRIVRALAIFRPSLIALQMPLTEEDEIFVERSIQRTILEFEKLVSFSGTPTVVWRRTCEICVVGAEFSMLTQWSREHLLGRYIYEFLDKVSILDYWENFAAHAFENTAQSMTMLCSLKTSTGSMVKCAACFSIKRDVFDLPSLVVANFLPILS